MNKEAKAPAKKRDKVFTILGIVFCVILIPLLIANVTMIIKSYTNEDKVPSFLGVTPMIVLTDSMAETINSGDLIMCTEITAEEVQVGDIISFFDPLSKTGAVVTHRVIEIVPQDDGSIKFRTKGDNNNTEDKVLVDANKLVGEYWFRLPAMGNVAIFLQSTPGLILCCVVPLILLVGYDVLRRKLYDRNKKDDMSDLMAELEALRAAQAAQQATAETPVEAPAEEPVEAPAETPAEEPVEAPAEEPAEAPAEEPKAED
jgi:signal peptidase